MTTAYEAAKTNAAAVLDETAVNGKRVALLKMHSNGTRYMVITSGGGSEKCGRNEQLARRSFEAWTRALAAR